MWNYFDHMGWGGNFFFGFGWIFMIIFWGLVIWAIFALVRSGSGHDHGEKVHGGKTALDILKERDAKGEVNKEDFDRMKKDLE